jgi:predicted PurR-regulated permease PerM
MAQAAARSGDVASQTGYVARWTSVFTTIGILVVVVVIGFLLGIISALEAIDRSLAVTTNNVTGINADVDPLPAHVDTINKTLDSIDVALKPIPAQADSIIGSLTSINGKLQTIDTSAASTAGILVTALGGLRDIDGTLNSIDQTARFAGTNITKTVQGINGVLTAAKSDTGAINKDLDKADGVAKHVHGICSRLQNLLAGLVVSGCAA